MNATTYTNAIHNADGSIKCHGSVELDLATVEGMAEMIRICGMRSKILKGGKIRITWPKTVSVECIVAGEALADKAAMSGLWMIEESGKHVILTRTDKPAPTDPDPSKDRGSDETIEDPATLFIDIEPDGIYALGYKLDRFEFENAARRALQDAHDAGEPLTLWHGQTAAIDELGGDVERRRWLSTRSDECLAGLLVAERLMSTTEVRDIIAEEYHPDDDVDLDFAILPANVRLIPSPASAGVSA